MDFKNPIPRLQDARNTDDKKDKRSTFDEYGEYTERKDMYFVFIDVLGFKKTFNSKETGEQCFAERCKKTFQYYSHLINTVDFARECTAGQTSDSLYFYTERSDFLARFIYLYGHFSLYAMSQGVFFRGGIAKGNLFVKQPHQFYGDSVIRAYLLENEIAKMPRIVIDQATREDLRKEPGIGIAIEELNGRNYIKPFFKQPEEFFQIVGIEQEDLQDINEKIWRKILEVIEANRRDHEFEDPILQKYDYLLQELKKFKTIE